MAITRLNNNSIGTYEEGTWTPSFNTNNGDANISYSSRSGTYRKIGNLVYINCRISCSITSNGTGNYLQLEGLPFTGVGDRFGGFSIGGINGCNATASVGSTTMICLNLYNGLDYLRFNGSKASGGNGNFLNPTNTTFPTYLMMGGIYSTSV